MEAAIAAREVAPALFFEFACAEKTLRCWNRDGDVTTAGITGSSVTWAGLGGRIQLPQGIQLAADLGGQTVPVHLDGSRISDNSDFTGEFVDLTWHQRPVTIHEALFAVSSSFVTLIGVLNVWNGIMNRGELVEGPEQSVWSLSCEGGAYLFWRTNQHRRTYSNQQRLAPGDEFFGLTAVQTLQSIPFGTDWRNIAGQK
jgi:hypothetical protein